MTLKINASTGIRLELLSKFRGKPPADLAEELLAKTVQSAIDELPTGVAQAIETLASETVARNTGSSVTGAGQLVEYTSPRLRFIRRRIEELQPGGILRIHVRSCGTFEFKKENIETDFRNVLESHAYQEAGYYHYPTVPKRALKYRVSSNN